MFCERLNWGDKDLLWIWWNYPLDLTTSWRKLDKKVRCADTFISMYFLLMDTVWSDASCSRWVSFWSHRSSQAPPTRASICQVPQTGHSNCPNCWTQPFTLQNKKIPIFGCEISPSGWRKVHLEKFQALPKKTLWALVLLSYVSHLSRGSHFSDFVCLFSSQ